MHLKHLITFQKLIKVWLCVKFMTMYNKKEFNFNIPQLNIEYFPPFSQMRIAETRPRDFRKRVSAQRHLNSKMFNKFS